MHLDRRFWGLIINIIRLWANLYLFLVIVLIITINSLGFELFDASLDNTLIKSCRANKTAVSIYIKNLSNDNALFSFYISGRASIFVKDINFELNLGKDSEANKKILFYIPRDTTPGEYPYVVNISYTRAARFFSTLSGRLVVEDCEGRFDYELPGKSRIKSNVKKEEKEISGNKMEIVSNYLKNPYILAVFLFFFVSLIYYIHQNTSSAEEVIPQTYIGDTVQLHPGVYDPNAYTQYGSYTYPQYMSYQTYYNREY